MILILSSLLICFVKGEYHKVEGKVLFQMQRELIQDDPNLQITLNYGQYATYLQKNGLFLFHNIPSGRYFLQIESRNFIYESAVIDVYSGSKGPQVIVTKIHPITRQRPQYSGQDKQRKAHSKDVMLFEAIQRIDYFEKDEELSLATIYKNQYFWIVASTLGMLYFVKKMPMEDMQNAVQQPAQ